MQNISKNDEKRIIRVLEIYKETGKTKTEIEEESKKNGVEFDYTLFVINMEREVLYERINKRVDLMIKQGLIQEVQEILKKYKEMPTAIQGLGYKETKEYLRRRNYKRRNDRRNKNGNQKICQKAINMV